MWPDTPRLAEATRASVKLETATLERYVGHYTGRGNFTVELSMKEGRLYAQSPGTIQFEMLATSEPEFLLKETPDIE